MGDDSGGKRGVGTVINVGFPAISSRARLSSPRDGGDDDGADDAMDCSGKSYCFKTTQAFLCSLVTFPLKEEKALKTVVPLSPMMGTHGVLYESHEPMSKQAFQIPGNSQFLFLLGFYLYGQLSKRHIPYCHPMGAG